METCFSSAITRDSCLLGERQQGDLLREHRVIKKGKRKLNEKQMTEQEQRKRVAIMQLEKLLDESTARLHGKYCDVTKDELVSLCKPSDRPRARRVVDDLRKYLTQVSESQGFDIDVYPGFFDGVTDIYPVRYCGYNVVLNTNLEWLAKAGITKYNIANVETKFEVVDVEQVNVRVDMACTYYVTFRARDVKNSARANDLIKTFQAIVVAQWMTPNEGNILDIVLCRPKPI